MVIERNPDKTRTFKNTDGISHKNWTLIYNRLNYLGYGFDNVDEVKDYLNQGHALQLDQSKAIVSILNGHMTKTRKPKNAIEKCNEKAKRTFGITDRCSAIGYILTDGTALKLSYDGFTRNRDHREISDVVKNPRIIDRYAENTCAMIQFINYGNIRVLGYGFELSNRLTPEQFKALKHYVSKSRMHDIQIDIAN